MKHAYLLLLLLLALPGRSQNFCPFRPGVTYQLHEAATPGDTIHGVRLARVGTRVGADSVFAFAPRTSSLRRSFSGAPFSQMQRPDHFFGASLTCRPGSEYVLAAANGRTLVLRPRAALNQPWAAAPGLTARVVARSVLPLPVANAPAADTCVTVAFSDGQQLLLSKNYGFVQGPVLGNYLNPRLPRKALTLLAQPERPLGTVRLGALAAFDFAPGDVFVYQGYSYGSPFPCGTDSWTRDSVLSRADSPGRDTITYRIWSRTVSQMCANGPRLAGPANIRTLVVSADYRGLGTGSLTQFWANRGGGRPVGWLHFVGYRAAVFGNRYVQENKFFMPNGAAPATADTLALLDAGALDSGYHLTLGEGLGAVHEAQIGFSGVSSNLIGFRKNGVAVGQLPTIVQLMLSIRATRPAATTAAFPQPFAENLTVKFDLARPQPVALVLHDGLGRTVLTRPATAQPAGAQQLELDTRALPAGLYTLHLAFGGEGRTEVLKVLKN